MQGMIESFRKPSAEQRYCFCIPLLEKVQDPQIVVYFAANQIDVVAGEIYVTLTEFFAGARNILKN
jgi:hypothetical protein